MEIYDIHWVLPKHLDIDSIKIGESVIPGTKRHKIMYKNGNKETELIVPIGTLDPSGHVVVKQVELRHSQREMQ